MGSLFTTKAGLQKGVVTLHNVIDTNGKFMSLERFKHVYRVHCNFLQYLQVLSAIPRALLEKGKGRDKADATLFQLTPLFTIELLKLRSKDCYWFFLNKSKCQAIGPSKWERGLAPAVLPWSEIFNRVKVICKQNHLRDSKS